MDMSKPVNNMVNICARTVLKPYQDKKIATGATLQKVAAEAPERRAADTHAAAIPEVSPNLRHSSPAPPKVVAAARRIIPVPHS
jgi:hypothetical protein